MCHTYDINYRMKQKLLQRFVFFYEKLTLSFVFPSIFHKCDEVQVQGVQSKLAFLHFDLKFNVIYNYFIVIPNKPGLKDLRDTFRLF